LTDDKVGAVLGAYHRIKDGTNELLPIGVWLDLLRPGSMTKNYSGNYRNGTSDRPPPS
jgi:hypothetical protein